MRASYGWLVFLAGLASSAGYAPSDNARYPVRPVRLVVPPYAAGGSSDVLARVVGQRLSERLGQQFVIDAGSGTIDRVIRSSMLHLHL
jgi:tripartite-type tricarboxylate transporter receptor subunit TctC